MASATLSYELTRPTGPTQAMPLATRSACVLQSAIQTCDVFCRG